jgi:hypothetical protein
LAHSVHVALAGHPTNPARFHQRLDIALTRQPDGALALAYTIRGQNLDLRVPTPHAPAPADALWKTTCCELFVGPAGRPDYREFNFSPSGQWAVYDFLDYRAPKPGVPACHAPTLQTRREEDLLQLDVLLPRTALPPGDMLRIAVSAVLEANDGNLGYWALAHAAGKPDFHRAGFMLCLGAVGFRPTRCP